MCAVVNKLALAYARGCLPSELGWRLGAGLCMLGGPESSAGRFLVRDSNSESRTHRPGQPRLVTVTGLGSWRTRRGAGGVHECAPASDPEHEEEPFDGVLSQAEADSASEGGRGTA